MIRWIWETGLPNVAGLIAAGVTFVAIVERTGTDNWKAIGAFLGAGVAMVLIALLVIVTEDYFLRLIGKPDFFKARRFDPPAHIDHDDII